MVDWRDFTVIFCLVLLVLGCIALVQASQTSTIVRGKVMEKTGVLVNLPEGKSYYAQAVSVLIENDDRVFRIERGTVVKYAISDDDASGLDVGSTVVLFVSVYDNFAKVIKHDGSNQI